LGLIVAGRQGADAAAVHTGACCGQRGLISGCALRTVTPLARYAHKGVPVKDGAGALGGHADIASCSPMRLPDDHTLDGIGKLVGVTDRPSRAVRKSLHTLIPIAIEKLIARLAGDAELPAEVCHGLAFKEAGDKA
jgi:hypothetical protein